MLKSDRIENKKTYIVTGATGFMGQRLVRALVRAGDQVILFVRRNNHESAQERIRTLFNFSVKESELVHVIDCDIRNLDNVRDLQDFRGLGDIKIDGIWHLIADLSFKKEDKNRVFSVNNGELIKSLNLAGIFSCPIYYVSTAYIHGKVTGEHIFEKFLPKPFKFNNYYEESKFRNEEIIYDWSKNPINRFIIFRPSILIEENGGDGANNFGYYSVIKSLYCLKKNISSWIKKYKLLSKILFIQQDKNGEIHIPLPFFYSNKASLNLIPVSIVINWMIKIVNKEDSINKIFNLTNPHSFSMKEVTQQTMGGLNLHFKLIPAPTIIVYMFFKFIELLGVFMIGVRKVSISLKYYGFYMLTSNNYDITNTMITTGDNMEIKFNQNTDFLKNITKNFVNKLEIREKYENRI